MSGLIWAGIGKGIADAGTSIGSSMLRSVADEERQQERMELQRERLEAAQQRQDERLAQSRELTQARLDAKSSGGGSGSGGLSAAEIGSGGADEGMIARAAGMTVPELRALRNYSQTGNVEPFKRDVTRYGRDQDDGMAGANDEYSDAVSRKNAKLTEEKVRELPPGFDQEIRARSKALAKIEESYRLGGKYDDVTKGRLNDQQRDLTSAAVNNPDAAPQVAMGVAAGKGNDMYGGDSNVTRQKFTGQTSATTVGESQIIENKAQAGQAAAAGRKSDADANRVNDRSDPETMRMRADFTQRERTLRTQLGKAMLDEKDAIQTELNALLQERKDFEAQVTGSKTKAGAAKPGDNGPAVVPSRSNAPAVVGLPKGAVQIGTSGGRPVYQTPDGKKFIKQ